MKYSKYRALKRQNLPNRTWPDQEIMQAPKWCSVDLRDGNQALETPMNLHEKIEYFQLLTKIGFKEIEISFPAASDTDFEFTRYLIENNQIPNDVSIQVLTQSRNNIIERTFKALEGVPSAIVHFYNSTSILQREVVFKKSKNEIKQIAIDGAIAVKQLAKQYGKERFRFQYSPESFTGTEIEFAAEVCNAVIDILEPTPEKKCIINLPATVEMTSPHIYADQIELMKRLLVPNDSIEISVHTHNDRGCAVAASELALLAGATRVEGTLFGNGERTGNADIITLALNLLTQGIDPQLNLSAIDAIIDQYECLCKMKVHERQPYAGNLVFTAFSGSHQDAISKGIDYLDKKNGIWEVPYLPIDPKDLGRDYEPIIRINSQSGKGGIAYILKTHYGLQVPHNMQMAFSSLVKSISDEKQTDLSPKEIFEIFEKEYINIANPLALKRHEELTNHKSHLKVEMIYENTNYFIEQSADGIMEAFVTALNKQFSLALEVEDYQEHALDYGKGSRAVTFVTLSDQKKQIFYGVGISKNITRSSLKAIVSAFNQKIKNPK